MREGRRTSETLARYTAAHPNGVWSSMHFFDIVAWLAADAQRIIIVALLLIAFAMLTSKHGEA